MLGLQASLIFSLSQSVLAVLHYASNISNRARMHIRQLLMSTSNTKNLNIVAANAS